VKESGSFPGYSGREGQRSGKLTMITVVKSRNAVSLIFCGTANQSQSKLIICNIDQVQKCKYNNMYSNV
jgi:hypothetical protein